jgi:Fe-S cluster assembly protein SufD
MAQVAERQSTLSAAFEALRADAIFDLFGLGPARERAFGRFLEQGFPTTRQEEWRHTSVAPLAQVEFARAPLANLTAADVAPYLLAAELPHRLVLVNGRFAPALSALSALPAGVTVRSLREAAASGALVMRPVVSPDDPSVFVELNAAFLEDGVVVDFAPNAVVAEPVHIVSISAPGDTPSLVCPRILITARERSQGLIVESYAGLPGAAALVSAVTQIEIEAGAVLDHVKFQREQSTTFHLASIVARLDRAATLTAHAVTLGGRIARNDISATLAGEGGECRLDGLYIGHDDMLVDTHTTIDHAMPHCPSHELYKGILTGRARAVFNGKIIVRQDAQKTNAKQTNKALLLSDEARVNTKPQLEIFADDVKCTHGAAIGQLDEDAMFYLQSRGIAWAEARNLLIHAFAGEVLGSVREEVVREQAMLLLEEKLSLWQV